MFTFIGTIVIWDTMKIRWQHADPDQCSQRFSALVTLPTPRSHAIQGNELKAKQNHSKSYAFLAESLPY